MRIRVLTTFLDGTDRFEQADVRTVDDERGARFVANGWAEDLSGAVLPAPTSDGAVTLDVQSAALTAGDNHG